MNTNLSVVFEEICYELGCNQSDASPALQILNKNFFYRLKDIKNIDLEIWRSLNLPINLLFILKEKIKMLEGGGSMFEKISNPNTNTKQTVFNNEREISKPEKNFANESFAKQTQTVNNFQANNNAINRQTDKISFTSPTPVDIHKIEKKDTQELKEVDEFKDNIYRLLDNLLKIINNKEKSCEVIKKLHTIIMNIISNPDDEKYRKLKLDSKFFQSYVLPYKQALEFLGLIGFAKLENEYICVADEKTILRAGEVLNEFIIERKIAELNFNPYQTSIIGTGATNVDDMRKVVQQTNFDDLLRKEKQRREELIFSSKTTSRNPHIIHINNSSAIGSIIQTLNEEDEKNAPKIEDQEFYKMAMNVLKGPTERFVMKSRTDYEKLINKPVYTKATIRIKFPSDLLLQADFAMMEKIGDIYEFISSQLNDPSQPFQLFTSFPSKKYIDKNATIYSQNLAPSTLMYITFPNIDITKTPDYAFIKSESLEKYRIEINDNFHN